MRVLAIEKLLAVRRRLYLPRFLLLQLLRLPLLLLGFLRLASLLALHVGPPVSRAGRYEKCLQRYRCRHSPSRSQTGADMRFSALFLVLNDSYVNANKPCRKGHHDNEEVQDDGKAYKAVCPMYPPGKTDRVFKVWEQKRNRSDYAYNNQPYAKVEQLICRAFIIFDGCLVLPHDGRSCLEQKCTSGPR